MESAANSTCKALVRLWIIVLGSILLVPVANAQEHEWHAGLQLGSTVDANNNKAVAGILVHRSLPKLSWLGGLKFSHGRYFDSEDDTTWSSVGVYWNLLSHNSGTLLFEFGPTYIGHKYAAGHLIGSHWHFTSAIMYRWRLPADHWDLGIRFQHVSNAGYRHPNPGLDTASLVIQYRFQ